MRLTRRTLRRLIEGLIYENAHDTAPDFISGLDSDDPILTAKSTDIGLTGDPEKERKRRTNLQTKKAIAKKKADKVKKASKVGSYVMKDKNYSKKNPYAYYIKTDKDGKPAEIVIISGGKASPKKPLKVKSGTRAFNKISDMWVKMGGTKPLPHSRNELIAKSTTLKGDYDKAQSQALHIATKKLDLKDPEGGPLASNESIIDRIADYLGE